MKNNVCIRVSADLAKINKGRTLVRKNQESFSILSKLLGLAGNEVRLKILYLLYEDEELCVCDLSDILGMKIPAVSQHLRKLKDGGILGLRKDGPTYYYFIKEENLIILESLFNLIHSKSKILKPI